MTVNEALFITRVLLGLTDSDSDDLILAVLAQSRWNPYLAARRLHLAMAVA